MTSAEGPQLSSWVQTWASAIVPWGQVLDVACGEGRHARWLAQRGFTVTGVDRSSQALAALAGLPLIHTVCHDLEADGWPFDAQLFDAVVVTNYLFRPLFPSLLTALAPRGVIIYETFAVGNERYGRPANPDFLLKPGELLDVLHGDLHVLAYEDRYVDTPKPAMVQRICAVRADASTRVWR